MAKARKLPSGSWTCQVYSHTEITKDKKRRVYQRFTARTKKEAEFLAAEFTMDKERRMVPENLTVKEVIREYIDAKQNILSPSTVVGYESMLKTAYDDIDIPVAKLNSRILQRYFNQKALAYSPKTLRNISGLLSAAILFYVPDFSYHVHLPPKERKEMYIPKESDIRTILARTQGSPIHLAILLASGMGLRRSEIAGLVVSDVDSSTRTLSINSAMVKNSKNEWSVKGTKTYSGKRTLPIPDYIFPLIQEAMIGKNKSAGLVGLSPTKITNDFIHHVERMDCQHFNFHSLRHYYASMLLANNVPNKYALKRMGHATDDMLKNVYQHVISERDHEVTDVINVYLGNAFGS